MVGSEYDLKMYARDLGYTLPLIIGAQNHPFRRLRNGKFNGLCLRNERRYRQWGKWVGNYKGLVYCFKMLQTLVHKRLKIGQEVLPTLLHSSSLQAFAESQTEISKRNSTKHC